MLKISSVDWQLSWFISNCFSAVHS